MTQYTQERLILTSQDDHPKAAPDGRWLLGRVMLWELEPAPESPLEELTPVFEPDGRTHHLYRHFDAAGVLLYVGVSLSALVRLGQHKENAHWFNRIARVDIQTFPSRKAVLAAERHAVQAETPAHNIKLQRKAA